MKLSKILQHIRADYNCMPHDAGIAHTYISIKRISLLLRIKECNIPLKLMVPKLL